jgi:glycosyltransferase involved in cell wall biosynthesis
MDQPRKKIGILFISNDIGVVYYLCNIIKSLNFLRDEEKPFLRIYYTDQCAQYLDLLDYELKELVQIQLVKSYSNYAKSMLGGDNFVLKFLPKTEDLNGIFPFNDFPGRKPKTNVLLVSWIPDFQHKFYPNYFTRKNLFLREQRFKRIVAKSDQLVLSSNDANAHLQQYFTAPEKLKITILQFVSMIKSHKLTDFSVVKEKYQLSSPFFLVSNQFYEHKNHLVVLKAIHLLKRNKLPFQVVFSGLTEDYRNPDYFPGLIQFIKKYELENFVKIVGLIPREDQLSMLVNSVAVIQPSKFEGWSTIIEDAKTLAQQVICSSIPVHKEQLNDMGFYFHPDSEAELASLMTAFLDESIIKKSLTLDYDSRIMNFAQSFVKIFNS